jgi:hypothetical protein
MIPWSKILESPVWRAKNFITYAGDAQAPTLWDFDRYGYAKPSNGRVLSAQEKIDLDKYNDMRKQLHEADLRVIDHAMKSLFPLTGDSQIQIQIQIRH